ncbi:MAG: hypothetical protein HDT25_11090 [Ruminococcus sp.]|nr:hypothetical protein [Ruminococcus sp.]
MLNSKKVISAILALSMIATTSAVVYAENDVNASTIIAYSTNNERSINWTYTSWVAAGIIIDGNYGKCTGSYELYSDMKSEITVTLMKSKDGNSWSKVESWTATNYDYSPSSLSKTSTNELEHGYYYCTHTQVQVYSNNKVVETGNSFSNSKYYA